VPAPQLVQLETPARSLYVPAEQLGQALAAEAEKVPALQLEQLKIKVPIETKNFPATHAEQLDDPTLVW